jgi:branched-chain amino acid transport system permease protein
MLSAGYKTIPLVILLVILLLVPFFLPYHQGLALDIVILGVFASAYNLVFGHMGIVSMGHGLFFGLGGYIAGILITRWSANLLCLIIGILAGTFVAFLVGWVVFRRLRIGTPALTKLLLVVIFTLGASLVTYYLFLSPLVAYTGGSNGLAHMKDEPLRIIGGVSIDLKAGLNAYYFVVVIGVICLAVMQWILSSPLGIIIHAIREHELRVPFLGHSLFRAQTVVFTISGFFSAVAGTLFIARYGIIDLSVFQWVFIFEVITICLIGGRRSVHGPLVGTIVYYVAKDILSEYTGLWLLIMALFIVTIVLVMPEGIVPGGRKIIGKLRWRVSS